MKQAKLLLTVLLCFALVLLFVSCKPNKNGSNTTGTPSQGENGSEGNENENEGNENENEGGGETNPDSNIDTEKGEEGSEDGDEGTEGGEESGGGNENLGGGNEEDNGNSDNDVTEPEPEKEKRELNVNLENASEFKDGYAFVSYKQNNARYGAIINSERVVIYKTYINSKTTIDDWHHIGNGYFIIVRSKDIDNYDLVYEVIDSSGNVTASSLDGKFDRILGTGDGNVLVCKDSNTVTASNYLYALIDTTGNFVTDFASASMNVASGYSSFDYLGDGVFVSVPYLKTYKIDLTIYSSKDSTVTCLRNVTRNDGAQKLVNGAIYLKAYGASIYDNSTGKLQSLPQGTIAMKPDGTYETAETCSYISNGKLIDTTGEYIKITDPATNTTITYTNYTTKYALNAICYGEYSIITLYNAGVCFFTAIDSTGKQLFEPIACGAVNEDGNTGLKNFIYDDGKIIYYKSGSESSLDVRRCGIINVADGSEVINPDLKYDIRGYSDGVILVRVLNYVNGVDHSYFIYLNESGERLALYEYCE